MDTVRVSPAAGQKGFTLVELLFSLILLLLAVAISSQLLLEASRMFVEAQGEAGDTPIPLAIARIRNDIQGAYRVEPVTDRDGRLTQIDIRNFDGQIFYRLEGDALYRIFHRKGEDLPQEPALLWRDVVSWRCQRVTETSLIDLEVTYTRRSTPKTPLPVLPAYRGQLREMQTQRMFLCPRGGGLGWTW